MGWGTPTSKEIAVLPENPRVKPAHDASNSEFEATTIPAVNDVR
jgi:hypothetical protein